MRKRNIEIPLYNRPGPVLTGGGGSPVPSAESMGASAKLGEQFAAGVEKLTGQAIGLAGQMLDAKRKIRAREIDNELQLEFNKRFVDVSMSRRGTAVDGLLDEEHDFLKKQDADLEKRFGIEDKALGEMVRAKYSSYANSYLNKLAGHSINELETADQTSRSQAVQVQFDLLSDSEIGDDAAIEYFINQVAGIPDETGARRDGIYSDRFQNKILPTIDEGVKVAVENWAYKDPEKTEQWVLKNEKLLRTHLGEGYTKVIDAMRAGTARKLADDNQAYAAVKRYREEVKLQTNEDFVQKWIDGKLTTDEIRASELPPTGQGSKQWWVAKLAKGNETTIKNDPAVHLSFIDAASRGELDRDAVFAAAEAGRLKATTVQTLLNTDSAAKKNLKKPYDAAYKAVVKEARDTLVAGGMFAPKNPKDIEAANNCVAYFQSILDTMDSDQEKLEFLRDREKVTSIIKTFRPSEPDRLRTNLEQLKPDTSGLTPEQRRENIRKGLSPAPTRNTGESIDDYKKRTGL